MNSWTIFNNWNINTKNTWDDFDVLNQRFKQITLSKYKTLLPLIKKWDKLTKQYGNDSTHINWDNFRPLRLSREEDWSDWLAFLIENSETGYFAKSLLNLEYQQKPKLVIREDICGGYRADIVINWDDLHFTHIEVKVGDENLLKTYNTCINLEKKYRNTKWTHFILLLSNQFPLWQEVEKESSPIKIKVLLWEDVAIALRRSLLDDEKLNWKVWCYSFAGAIEQNLIGYKGHLLDKQPLEKVDEKIEILTQALL